MNAGKSAPSSAWETGSRKPDPPGKFCARSRICPSFASLPAYEGRGVISAGFKSSSLSAEKTYFLIIRESDFMMYE
jgi:hypothetical protein